MSVDGGCGPFACDCDQEQLNPGPAAVARG